MFEFIYRQKISISHYMVVGYDTDGSENHGHLLTVSIRFQSTRLNADGMIIDEDAVKSFVDPLNGKNLNNFMRQNTLVGNATIENIIVYLKSRIFMYIKDFNTRFNTDVEIKSISVEDEEGKEYVYHYSK